MKVPYVHSNFDRKENDDYQTIDERCVCALENTVRIWGDICDVCSPNGSGIVKTLKELGFYAFGLSDAFDYVSCSWIVSNPPYKRGIVDKIIWKQIDRLSDGTVCEGVAMLLRSNFDFAKSRWDMFTNQYYSGQVHMMFRPWWSKERKAQPIHNYVWHIWSVRHPETPFVKYWREE